ASYHQMFYPEKSRECHFLHTCPVSRDLWSCHLQCILIRQVHCIPAQLFSRPDADGTTALMPPESPCVRLILLLPALEIYVVHYLPLLLLQDRASEKLSPRLGHLLFYFSLYPLC